MLKDTYQRGSDYGSVIDYDTNPYIDEEQNFFDGMQIQNELTSANRIGNKFSMCYIVNIIIPRMENYYISANGYKAFQCNRNK